MTYTWENSTELQQNLMDAGCDDQLIAHCTEYFRTNRIQNMRNLLMRQRLALLGDIHKRQKQLDCLDFLVHEISKENTIK